MGCQQDSIRLICFWRWRNIALTDIRKPARDLPGGLAMSQTETASELRVTRSNFASRMLSKELDVRKKTTKEMQIKPADAAKFAVTEEKQESKESVVV